MQQQQQYGYGDGAPNRRSFTQQLVFYGAVFLALLSLYDPVKDIYTTYLYPEIGDEPVEVALQQQKLTERNLDCLVGAQPQEVPLNQKVTVRLLACEKTGDIQVAVYPENAPAKLRWITPHVAETKTAGLAKLGLGGLFETPLASGVKPAQMQIATVCTAWEDETRRARLIRITNEGGQCFKEIVNVFTGRIDYREKAACNAPCR
jgi:hypothetical protein